MVVSGINTTKKLHKYYTRHITAANPQVKVSTVRRLPLRNARIRWKESNNAEQNERKIFLLLITAVVAFVIIAAMKRFIVISRCES